MRCLHGRAVLSFIAMVVASACSSGAPPSPAPSVEVAATPPEVESRTVEEPAAEPVEAPAATPPRASLAGVEVFGRCFLKTPGVYGSCIDTATCTSAGNHVSTPGLCGGPPNVSCCTEAPRAEVHPPAGWNSIPQTRVTGDMYAWALSIVGSSTAYPMGSRTTQVFGTREVMARVEWHTPNQGHGVMHRGVTLYEPL